MRGEPRTESSADNRSIHERPTIEKETIEGRAMKNDTRVHDKKRTTYCAFFIKYPEQTPNLLDL